MREGDFLVIGAGIAGASAAYELADLGRVTVLEREERPGYHATGRSAALYAESYGHAVVRAVTTAAKAFFTSPPEGFTPVPLLGTRGALMVARADQRASLEKAYAEISSNVGHVRRLSAEGCRALCPALGADLIGGLLDIEAQDIDVDALHQGFLRGARKRGGELICDAEVTAFRHDGKRWTVATKAGEFAAPVVVNAAGAWCDVVGALAGAKPLGLVPKRRTAFIFPRPDDLKTESWPAVIDIDEEFYFKPEAGALLGSPANEDPVEPHDVQPEELDIALAVDRIERATSLRIKRVQRRWAGLRSFVPDKILVAGLDADVPGFLWLAGQGGYGIQTSPAMGRIAAALATGRPLPDDIRALGVEAKHLSPSRLR